MARKLIWILISISIYSSCHTKYKIKNKTIKRFNDTTITTELKIKLDSVIMHSDDVIKYEKNSKDKKKISYYVCKIPVIKKNKVTYQATLTFDTINPGWFWLSKIFIDSTSLKVMYRSVN